MVREDKRVWQQALVSRFQKNPKLLFKHVNRLRQVKHGIPPLETQLGLTETIEEASETLLKFYSEKSTSDPLAPIPLNQTNTVPRNVNTAITHVYFTPEGVHQKLQTLRMHAAAGLDNITPRVLIHLAPTLAAPLAAFFQHLFNSGTIPDQWKQGVITPAYKGGRRSDPANYRPITLLPVVSKVMESVVADQLRDYLESTHLLAEEQHGFRKQRSCLTNLLLARDAWTKSLDRGNEIDVIYLDFSKAFDRVHHPTLISKLGTLGVGGTLLSWITYYLHGRSISVRVAGTVSSRARTHSGVPQGSVLGPLLFLTLINDLPKVLTSPCQIFADDVKLWREIHSEEDAKTLQSDLHNLHTWSIENRLPFNLMKCRRLPLRNKSTREYHLGDHKLETSQREQDLGVIIQGDLGTSVQCQKAAKTANKLQALFRRALGPLDGSVLRTLVSTYIRPSIEYSTQAWSPWYLKDIRLLEQPQRRATKLAIGLHHLPYPARLEALGLFSASYRRLRGDLILVYQILVAKNHPCKALLTLAKSQHLRGHRLKLATQHSHLECRHHFFSLRVCRSWNSLPESVIEAPTIAVFKQRLDLALEALRYNTL